MDLQQQLASIQAEREAEAAQRLAEKKEANREALRDRFVAAFGFEPSEPILSSGKTLDIGHRGVGESRRDNTARVLATTTHDGIRFAVTEARYPEKPRLRVISECPDCGADYLSYADIYDAGSAISRLADAVNPSDFWKHYCEQSLRNRRIREAEQTLRDYGAAALADDVYALGCALAERKPNATIEIYGGRTEAEIISERCNPPEGDDQ